MKSGRRSRYLLTWYFGSIINSAELAMCPPRHYKRASNSLFRRQRTLGFHPEHKVIALISFNPFIISVPSSHHSIGKTNVVSLGFGRKSQDCQHFWLSKSLISDVNKYPVQFKFSRTCFWLLQIYLPWSPFKFPQYWTNCPTSLSRSSTLQKNRCYNYEIYRYCEELTPWNTWNVLF